MTKREAFETLKAMVEVAEFEDREERDVLTAFLDHEVELLNKKSSSKGLTKAEIEARDADYEAILAGMANTVPESEDGFTVAEIMTFTGTSNQKTTSRLTALKRAGKIESEIIKKKSYYRLITEVEEG